MDIHIIKAHIKKNFKNRTISIFFNYCHNMNMILLIIILFFFFVINVYNIIYREINFPILEHNNKKKTVTILLHKLKNIYIPI